MAQVFFAKCDMVTSKFPELSPIQRFGDIAWCFGDLTTSIPPPKTTGNGSDPYRHGTGNGRVRVDKGVGKYGPEEEGDTKERKKVIRL